MDGFWSKRCLNYGINVPNKIGSISSDATTSMVVKSGTKKTFEGFFWFKTCLMEMAVMP